jgi:pyruvate-formate lyase-activating enzyme
VTVRLGSARAETYEPLHGPTEHRWSDVRASMQLLAQRRAVLTIALLLMPGLTDAPAEIDALAALLGELPGGRIELRDLGADPLRLLSSLPPQRPLGLRALLARLGEADHFRIPAAPVIAAV